MYVHGWYHLAFERDLNAELTAVDFGQRKLMCVRDDRGVTVFDAICPHRGAHLVYGGQLAGEHVICPFHGYKIRLGDPVGGEFCVRSLPTLTVGGLVFVKLSDQPAPDLPAFLQRFGEEFTIFPGFELQVRTSLEMIMENGFDSLHFKYVHGISNEPDFEVEQGPLGELVVSGNFEFPSWDFRRNMLVVGRARYLGRAFSPGVGFGSLAGDDPFNYTVITTATPSAEPGRSIVRITLALPRTTPDQPPPHEMLVNGLLARMREGLEKDQQIWDHLSLDSPVRWTPRDAPAIELNRWCERFRTPTGSPSSGA